MAVQVHEAFTDWKRFRQASASAVSVGFIPTMGALHEGHASLIRMAREEVGPDGHVVVSVFVNPTQFNDPADFEAYPSTRESDIRVAGVAGADAVVFPGSGELYPEGIPHRVEPADYGALTSLWEAAHRPGHFDGVVAVVRALFDQVQPDRAYFGEKDWQQLAVIRTLAQREFPDLIVVPAPTVREADGLAMSSRNARLSREDRVMAGGLHHALQAVVDAGGAPEEASRQEAALRAAGWGVEYLAVVDSGKLEATLEPGTFRRVIVAARRGGVRLIDNLPVPV